MERFHADALFVCPTLKKLTLPASLTEIVGLGQSDLRCPLEEISVAPGNPAYSSRDGVLYSADQTRLLLYPPARTGAFSAPEGVTEIGPKAFLHSALTSLRLGNSVARLGAYAFSQSSLRELDLGESLQTVGAWCFDDCQNLRSLTLPETVTALEGYALNACPRLRRLMVFNPATRFSGMPDGDSAINECAHLTVWGYGGSTSQAFCRAKGIPFRLIDEAASPPLTGDKGKPPLWMLLCLLCGGTGAALLLSRCPTKPRRRAP